MDNSLHREKRVNLFWSQRMRNTAIAMEANKFQSILTPPNYGFIFETARLAVNE